MSIKEIYNPYELVKELFPIHRTIAGPGIAKSLELIKKSIPDLKIRKIKSGKRVWDWQIPDEWSIDSGWIEDLNGNRIIDYAESNLRVVGFSEPVNRMVSHEELMSHLHFLEDQPTAIPYVTSYYEKNWGFCVRFNELPYFRSPSYRVVINSNFKKGHLRYGELVIRGKSRKEILFSTNLCHPSMANNELSGPAVLVGLIKHLKSEPHLNYSYRIIFIPETIGAIAYLRKKYHHLKSTCIGGLVATCLGDSGNFSYVPTRNGNTLTDKVARHVLAAKNAKFYRWDDRGSDERQFCWPTINLPIGSITRSKYREYPEYHTSLDNLEFVNELNLNMSIDLYIEFCKVIEVNHKYQTTILCEPLLSKHNLYSPISKKGSTTEGVKMLDIMNLMDGKRDLLDISIVLRRPISELAVSVVKLIELNYIKKVN